MEDELTSRLRVLAKKWSTNVTKLANRNLGKYKSLIFVESHSDITEGKVRVVSTASPTQRDRKYGYTKNVARAYEYGSGIHSRSRRTSPKQMGVGGKILITPRAGKKMLAFKWQVATDNPDQFVFLDDGRVLLPRVEHPGVKAANQGKGYLAPAITTVRKQMREDMKKEGAESVRVVFSRAFLKNKKK